MALYSYRAKSGPDKIIEGEVEATTKEAAIKIIESSGYFPIKVEEIASGKKTAQGVITKKIKSQRVTTFTRQLSTLIKSGIPILKGLDIFIRQVKENDFRAILESIRSDIKEGLAFSDALNRHPKNFSKFYISMVKAGEDSGTLEDVLNRVATYRERQQEIMAKIKIAMIYPLVMFLVGLGTVIFMLTFVMPRLMNIFDGMDTALPLPTKMLIASSTFLREKWFIAIGIGLVLFFIIRNISKTREAKLFFSSLKLKFPVISKFILRKELARFSRTLETLIASGIPILRALGLTIPVLDNEIIKSELEKGLKDLEDGASLGTALGKSKLFPPFATSLISVGEESGRIATSLGELADTYERELEENIKVFTTLLEPLMILVMGLMIGFVVLAMLLPIFQINAMVG